MPDFEGREVNCRCEPCPFDIRTLGYRTRKECPSFEGTKCLWHEVISGRKGQIFLSGGTAEEPLFISVAKDGLYIKEDFGLAEIHEQAKRIGAKRK